MGIPSPTKDVVATRRAQYLRWTGYSMVGAGIGFGALLTWLAGWQLGSILFVFAALSLTVPYLLGKRISLEFIAHYFMFLFIATMSAVAWRTGGLESPAVYALAIGGPMGILILSLRGSIVWVVLVLFELALLGYVRSRGLVVEQLLSESANQNITSVTIVAVVLILYLLLLQYQSAFAQQARAVTRSRGKVDDARTEAIRSYEEFEQAALVAAGEEGAGGLVGRLRTESDAGSRNLALAREQIEKMFSDLTEVGPKVEELAKKSTKIVEHLATIERVSRKLDLMAINVALEAARAGEEGKTFGPLAQDMRRLAENAVAETAAIRDGIRGVSEESHEVGELATRTADSAVQSRDRIDELDRTFSSLLRLFEESTRATERARNLGRKQVDAIVELLGTDSEAAN